ncbi:MAG: sulfotransferase [Pararhodobacter sp.]|nr:sulfotransferase [Pararhodobacter sp.]
MVEVVIGGVQKCGTTALHKYLQRHPQILIGEKKELHFFDDPTVDWIRPDYATYYAMFPERSAGQMRLDSSPSYIYLPHCLERLRSCNPDVRLIFIFRDPIERAWSHWSMVTSRGFETLGFDEAVRAEPDRLAAHALNLAEYKRFSYISRGFYGRQFRRALEVFPREQILCLSSNVLRENPNRVLARVAEHLDISPFAPAPPIEVNKGPGKPINMTQRTREFIFNALRDDIRYFSELSGVSTKHWEIFRAQDSALSAPARD